MRHHKWIIAIFSTIGFIVAGLALAQCRTDSYVKKVEQWMIDEIGALNGGLASLTISISAEDVVKRYDSSEKKEQWRGHVRIISEYALQNYEIEWTEIQEDGTEAKFVMTDEPRYLFIPTRRERKPSGGLRFAGIRFLGAFDVMYIDTRKARADPETSAPHLVIVIEAGWYGLPMADRWSIFRDTWRGYVEHYGDLRL